jgi:hypothetical protein
MSVKKFKFVSPGVFVTEVDNSQLPALPRDIGPVIIGRSLKGPSMRPVQVNSFSDFVETFGNPIFGGGSSDVWRAGPNVLAPSYSTYAAQAYLRNESPLIFVRLGGIEDDNATNDGKAGWKVGSLDVMEGAGKYSGGAFGLFMIPSASATTGGMGTGSLAAIFYARTGSIGLSGSFADGGAGSGAIGVFKCDGDKQFTAMIKDGSGNLTDKVVFNFSENSKLFIRNVFNTNPTLVSTDPDVVPSDNQKTYFLGETFERNITDLPESTDKGYAVILGLDSGSTEQWNQQMPLERAKTGWFFSQDFGAPSLYNPTNMQKLFRLVALTGGEWEQSNLKISISNISPSNNSAVPYGTFDVQIRQISDSDSTVKPVEQYPGCNLNPNSPDFIARKIGDTYTDWDSTNKRYIAYGNYVNQSRYIRVELDQAVIDATADAQMLPFGVYGPLRWRGFTVVSGGITAMRLGTTGTSMAGQTFVVGSQSNMPDSAETGSNFVTFGTGTANMTASFNFPEVPLRDKSTDGIVVNQKGVYFGATTNMANSNRFEPSLPDILRRKPLNADDSTPEVANALEYSWIFSLDDITTGSAGVLAEYSSGSRSRDESMTAISASTTGYKEVVSQGFGRFTTVLNGGFEGINILEREPFRNTLLDSTTANTNYAFATIDRAIDAVADAEVVECNMMTYPGLTNTILTNKLLDVCESRGDALAIIDIEDAYVPSAENASAIPSDRILPVDSAIDALDLRNLNNSYGCCYYPWVQITDTVTTGGSLWVPPSVVALGTFASSQARSELWFAPAGFNRGGLTEGSAGIPVTNVRSRLSSKERDDLYAANINPIAQFPAEGIVVFGQKTLQVTQSALDRINVRRLMIYVKREISRIAATLLFEQNVSATWNRFLGRTNPFLQSVKTRLGLTDFKVLLDETTTTPDLVDRNILYAKIFLKPARAIEFIALDFVITRSGASFED